ncbi:hypothetical protein [Streptomyces sp. fd1-xmd]|uniref:hypothetical protein n=1 Tax=Streptomyces sp. fd1-xmd TaxID=1812480 RepID=UPI0009909474|nr:hypothetical protein [Streptomyces sp. fd1-xmd]AQT73585.1 hypothetical protein B1K54_19815 [Streptomyces sp. fd1-xmd]
MSELKVHPWQDAGTAADPTEVPVADAEHAWIADYEPGNPWQAKLCLRTAHGTVAYPLTPHTMPDLLEGLVVVAQEQQGVTGADALYDPDAEGAEDGAQPDGPAEAASLHNGRAARLTGWAVVHELWEREDPKARLVMGAIVLAVFALGILLS